MSPIDQFIVALDDALKALSGVARSSRALPGTHSADVSDPGTSAALMRVNHSGEICAQALYSGQAVFARDARVRETLVSAAAEERDHLAWCRSRLDELHSRPSLLDPLWYAGSFGIGLVSGAAGDRWSMGFLAETEAQVERHLEGHLDRLPRDDARSREIVEQMKQDEHRHGRAGISMGAADLPLAVKMAMRAASQVITRTSYWF
jgi:ubiquinone biosynthesis monooxygenase Coq7